jgi:O-antigen/teichoic acid export membrane protein
VQTVESSGVSIAKPQPMTEKSAAREGLWVLCAQGLATAIALAMDAILFRTLAPAERGTLSTALALRNVLLYVADMGLALSTVRVASEFFGKGEIDKARTVFRRALGTRVILAIAVAGLAILLSPALARFPLASAARSTLVFACAAALLGMTATSWGVDVAQSTRRFGYFFAHQVVEALLRFAAVVAFIAIAGKAFELNAESMLWALAVAATLAGFFSVGLQSGDLPLKTPLDAVSREELYAQLRSFGRYAGAIMLLQTVSPFIELFIVQWQVSPTETAVFDGARRLASILPLLGGALVTVLLPRAALLDSTAACAAYVRKSLLASAAMAVVFAGGLALASGIIVPLLWGSRYDASIPALRWLCLAHAFSIVINPLALVFFPLKRLGLLLALNLAGIVLQIALGLWLIPQSGAMGAAWSTLAAKVAMIILFSLAMMIALKRGISAPEKAITPQ